MYWPPLPERKFKVRTWCCLFNTQSAAGLGIFRSGAGRLRAGAWRTGDANTGRLQLARIGQARFYRLRSDTALVIRRVEYAGSDLVLHYDLP